MASTPRNLASNSTSTTPAPPRATRNVPSPRAFLLPWAEFQIWHEYYHYMTFSVNRTEDTAKFFRDKVMPKMTSEWLIKFPALRVGECAFFFAHREAQMVKDSLGELVAELRLEADNEIDLEKERC